MRERGDQEVVPVRRIGMAFTQAKASLRHVYLGDLAALVLREISPFKDPVWK